MAVGDSLVDIMEYHNHSHPVLPVELPHQLQDLDLVADIQKCRRFVQEQILRLLGQRHGDPDTLPLPS